MGYTSNTYRCLCGANASSGRKAHQLSSESKGMWQELGGRGGEEEEEEESPPDSSHGLLRGPPPPVLPPCSPRLYPYSSELQVFSRWRSMPSPCLKHSHGFYCSQNQVQTRKHATQCSSQPGFSPHFHRMKQDEPNGSNQKRQ